MAALFLIAKNWNSFNCPSTVNGLANHGVSETPSVIERDTVSNRKKKRDTVSNRSEQLIQSSAWVMLRKGSMPQDITCCISFMWNRRKGKIYLYWQKVAWG